ncbi:hypothetical protein S40285_09826 [Stachybotrys chlorohalonatus IBT 40285]|uniref:Uncharacterized protein n=1 Tax=Stachybotrys chlorohalonatus (strain IBT 40285) TaxID=1283841 RepID=A0A084QZ52_STAC4|nr:hypothetical protein S40285_09826 [Stachybotrys chlorohalonata IBT 40285]
METDRGWKVSFFVILASITELGLSATVVTQAFGPYRDAAIWTLLVSLVSIGLFGWIISQLPDGILSSKSPSTKTHLATSLALILWFTAFVALLATHVQTGGGGMDNKQKRRLRAPDSSPSRRSRLGPVIDGAVALGELESISIACDAFAGLHL